ncbi:unnamed protein product [Lymnaea stagnalis]|uniref:Uncharacterized protein n=1 Tax=Lymnaea stagnalis TaxID=6523 RepID=A0AAV2IEN1_LYMST
MNVQERRDALKKHLISYLNTCEGKKCQRDKIWVEMSQYLKKSLSRKMYGVEKMNDLLEDFGDVILEKDGYIFLESSFTDLEQRKAKKQRPIHQTDARPSKSVDTFLQTNPGTSLTKTHNVPEASVIRPALSEPLQDEPLGFGIENDFPSLHTSKALAKASHKKTRNEKQRSLKDSNPNIQMTSPSYSVDSEILTAVSKPTVGHSVVNVHDYGAAEWPDMSVRMGKAPGTKLEIKVISVPSISLTKGARLTDADVNQQIMYCIETLNTAKEHVTLQAVENLLLKMYKVKAFHQLNLPERFFYSMPAAKEHQMLLSKVLVSIQTFVRSRSLCTLYELEESCREFHSERKSFDHLKLGPLQKIPVV